MYLQQYIVQLILFNGLFSFISLYKLKLPIFMISFGIVILTFVLLNFGLIIFVKLKDIPTYQNSMEFTIQKQDSMVLS